MIFESPHTYDSCKHIYMYDKEYNFHSIEWLQKYKLLFIPNSILFHFIPRSLQIFTRRIAGSSRSTYISVYEFV